jgi:hypothetical protein
MSLLAVALAAAVVGPSPAAATPYKPVVAAPHDWCGPQIDPQFTRYVAPAPSADGKNPLLRLISSPDSSYSIETTQWRTTRACLRSLRHVDFAH